MAAAVPLRRSRPTGALVLTSCFAVVVALVVAMLGAAPANAVVDEPPRPTFYEAPAVLPSRNGDVIRSEQLAFLLDPLDATSLVRNARRVLYRSTDRTGTAIAVSGTVLLPKSRWVGLGSRPVVGYAPGTQGMADRCAPSRQFSEGIEYEGIAAAWVRRGHARLRRTRHARSAGTAPTTAPRSLSSGA